MRSGLIANTQLKTSHTDFCRPKGALHINALHDFENIRKTLNLCFLSEGLSQNWYFQKHLCNIHIKLIDFMCNVTNSNTFLFKFVNAPLFLEYTRMARDVTLHCSRQYLIVLSVHISYCLRFKD